MSNMSYCRFENTATDLADCEEALLAMIDGSEDVSPLNEYEQRAAPRLLASAAAMLQTLIYDAGGDVTVNIDGKEQDLDRVDWKELFSAMTARAADEDREEICDDCGYPADECECNRPEEN